jgi:hypothetical protein
MCTLRALACVYRYEGGFVGGNMEGEGSYTWPSGVKYVGEWKVLHLFYCSLTCRNCLIHCHATYSQRLD